MLDDQKKWKRFARVLMYYLPLPWALYYTIVLIPFPAADGWSLLYHIFPSRSYWIVYAAILGALCILPWLKGKPLFQMAANNCRGFLMTLFRGYAIAMAATLSWLLILGVLGLMGTPPGGEDFVFALLILLWVPPLWAPVIGAVLRPRGQKNVSVRRSPS